MTHENSSSTDFDLEGLFLCIDKDWQKQAMSMFAHVSLHHELNPDIPPASDFFKDNEKAKAYIGHRLPPHMREITSSIAHIHSRAYREEYWYLNTGVSHHHLRLVLSAAQYKELSNRLDNECSTAISFVESLSRNNTGILHKFVLEGKKMWVQFVFFPKYVAMATICTERPTEASTRTMFPDESWALDVKIGIHSYSDAMDDLHYMQWMCRAKPVSLLHGKFLPRHVFVLKLFARCVQKRLGLHGDILVMIACHMVHGETATFSDIVELIEFFHKRPEQAARYAAWSRVAGLC